MQKERSINRVLTKKKRLFLCMWFWVVREHMKKILEGNKTHVIRNTRKILFNPTFLFHWAFSLSISSIPCYGKYKEKILNHFVCMNVVKYYLKNSPLSRQPRPERWLSAMSICVGVGLERARRSKRERKEKFVEKLYMNIYTKGVISLLFCIK